MFTHVRMRNFKSFRDVTIDLSSKKNVTKSLAIIYGINGSGKTTISEAFLLLKRTLGTMEIRSMVNKLLSEKVEAFDDSPLKQEVMIKLLQTRLALNGLEALINAYKTVDISENMSLEYRFEINGNYGSYYVEFDNDSIIKERLEYKLSQRRGVYFSLEDDDITINDRIFETKEFYDLIKNQAKMYWGKHSLLSILLFEMSDKSDTFINSNISNNLMDIILLFTGIRYKTADNEEMSSDERILYNLQSGTINISGEKALIKVGNALDDIFKSILKDVVKVFYKTHIENDKIIYRLFIRKQIDNRIFDLDFSSESSGTKEILHLLPAFVEASSGKCVIIDEYGVRIHDVLSAQLLEAISSQISGQLILTTHNTMIMECPDLPAESLYFITNENSNKSIKCVTEIENRLHPNYNYRTRYLTQEAYKSSLPEISGRIDLSGLVSLLN